jgi:hypothetical protein
VGCKLGLVRKRGEESGRARSGKKSGVQVRSGTKISQNCHAKKMSFGFKFIIYIPLTTFQDEFCS